MKIKKPIIPVTNLETFKVRISQIPPFDVAFKEMALNDYENLVAVIYRLNELIGINQKYIDLTEDVLEWVMSDGLNQAVIDKLIEWRDDGTLDEIINETLFNSKLDKSEFNLFKTQINQTLEDLEDNLTTELNKKVDSEDFITEINKRASVDYVNKELDKKLDVITYEKDYITAKNLIYKNGGINFMHRGLSAYYPENTYESFDYAGFLGAKGFEVDIQLTSDNQIVVMHDLNVDRMTNGTGDVNNLSYNYIRGLSINRGNNFDKLSNIITFRKVLDLDEFLILVKRYKVHTLIELKGNWNTIGYDLLISKLRSFAVLNQVGLMSFNLTHLPPLRDRDPFIALGYVTGAKLNQSKIDEIKAFGNVFTSLYVEEELSNNISICKLNDIPFTVWTVDDYDTAVNMLSNSVQSFTTNTLLGLTPTKTYKAFSFNITSSKLNLVPSYNVELCFIEDITFSNNILSFKVVYSKPTLRANNTASGTSSANIGSTFGDQYDIWTRSERTDSVVVQIKRKDGGTLNSLTQMEGVWFNLNVFMYDFL